MESTDNTFSLTQANLEPPKIAPGELTGEEIPSQSQAIVE